MSAYKRQQAFAAIAHVLGATDRTGAGPSGHLSVVLRRLIDEDRSLRTAARAAQGIGIAATFTTSTEVGKGFEQSFSEPGVFALLLAAKLNMAGLPQRRALALVRSLKSTLEGLCAEYRGSDARAAVSHTGNDEAGIGAVLVLPAGPLPMLEVETDPVTWSSRLVNVCRSEAEIAANVARFTRDGEVVLAVALGTTCRALLDRLATVPAIGRGRKS